MVDFNYANDSDTQKTWRAFMVIKVREWLRRMRRILRILSANAPINKPYQEFSIGIYMGETPFNLHSPANLN